MSPNTCALCGNPMTLVQERDQIFIGNREATVDVQRYRCDACDEVFYTKEQALAAQRDAATFLRQQEGLLTPDEIRSARLNWGLSQSALERLLGVGPKTVVRWERGTVFQNSSTDQLLRVLIAVPKAFEFQASQRGLTLIAGAAARPKAPCKVLSWKTSQSVPMKVTGTLTTLTDIPQEALK